MSEVYKELIEYLVLAEQTVTITKPNEIETEMFLIELGNNVIRVWYFSGTYVAHSSYSYKDVQELYIYVGSKLGVF